MMDRDYDMNEAREEYIARMEEEGYKVVYPDNNQLFIDIDTDEQYKLFNKQFSSLTDSYNIHSLNMYPSRNGLPGRHIIITMPFEMSDVERIAWQAIMGSDPFREFMSMMRVNHGDIHPTLFVENKEEDK